MQEAFEADVDVTSADIALYLVVARGDGHLMERSLASVGAAVAARISATRVLAVMHFTSFEAMRVNRAIRLVGPVNLDPARFEFFQRVVGMQVAED